MKKIFITGVLGFIGSHLAENLLKKGYVVIGIDNLSGSYPNSYYQKNIKILKKYSLFTLYKTDILDWEKISGLIKNNSFDFLIHCAAKTNVRKSAKYPSSYLKTNVLGTSMVLEAIKKYSPKTKNIVFSSSSIYGKQKTPFNEEMVPQAISFYGLSKYFMEEVCSFYKKEARLSITIIRPFSVFGPRGREDMLPGILFSKSIKDLPFFQFGDNQSNKRDWTYIDDLVSAITKIITHYHSSLSTTINIGSSRPVGIKTFIDLFTEITGRKMKIVKKPMDNSEMHIVQADIKKAKKLLNFSPSFTLSQGLTNYIKSRQKLA